MLLAKGAIQDRPFGKTIGAIALRGISGQLTVESDGAQYAVVFEHGHVVAASSPNLADGARAIALRLDLLQPSQVAHVEQWLAAVPDADVFQVIAQVALMSPEDIHRLRRRVIAQRAARVIALERGTFTLTTEVSLEVVPNCEMHVGGIIHQSARMYLGEAQLRHIVGTLGARFELRSDYHELIYFGFGDAERAPLHALTGGVTLDTLLQLRSERATALAVVYALASCGALLCEASASSSRFARGTASPVRTSAPGLAGLAAAAPATAPMAMAIATATATAAERTSGVHAVEHDPQHNAEEAFKRAQAALKGNRVDDAVFDLELATQLQPNEPRYFSALAWAQFCRADDKAKVAGKTRAVLGRAIARNEKDVQSHFWLGMVDRIMNRTDEAMEHFREVLELQPHHTEAATELRFLARKR